MLPLYYMHVAVLIWNELISMQNNCWNLVKKGDNLHCKKVLIMTRISFVFVQVLEDVFTSNIDKSFRSYIEEHQLFIIQDENVLTDFCNQVLQQHPKKVWYYLVQGLTTSFYSMHEFKLWLTVIFFFFYVITETLLTHSSHLYI